MKKLVRELTLTRAYQLGTDAPSIHREVDPANRLVWRHSPRRLSAEELRDSILATSGRLQIAPPGPSPATELKMIEMRDNGPEAARITEAADRSTARSVFLPLLRGIIPKAIEPFDPVSQTLVSGTREETTVPTQALFLLNAAFVRQQALALAERVRATGEGTDEERIHRIYRRVFGRNATDAEVARASGFIVEYAASYRGEHPAEPGPIAATTPTETDAGAATAIAGQAANPDDVDRAPLITEEAAVEPKDARAAAWMSFVQSLYASAEFRFVR